MVRTHRLVPHRLPGDGAVGVAQHRHVPWGEGEGGRTVWAGEWAVAGLSSSMAGVGVWGKVTERRGGGVGNFLGVAFQAEKGCSKGQEKQQCTEKQKSA